MTKKEAILFLEKLVNESYSDTEYAAFLEFLNQCDTDDYSEIIDLWQEVLEAYEGTSKFTEKASRRKFSFWPLVATVLLIVSTGIYLFVDHQPANQEVLTSSIPKIEPGGNSAVLTLGNGEEVVLEGKLDGEIVSDDGVRIVKSEDGWLVYELSSAEDQEGAVNYNTISTPRGGQYRVKLPDGT